MKNTNLIAAINSMDDRFIDEQDKQFLTMILNSLNNGQAIKVEKPTAPQKTNTTWSQQDRENLKSIGSMFDQHSRTLIEQVYLEQNKDLEKALDCFLTNNLPKPETIKVTVEKPAGNL